MQRIVLSLFLLFALPLPAQATALFWIGGTGNTSDQTHWSASSGGLTCSCTPVAADTVTLDTNSGIGTVTVNTALSATSITHSKASLSLSASAAMTISGAVTVTAGTLVTGAFTHSFGSFVSTSGTRTVTLTNSTFNITAASGTPWNLSTAGTLTANVSGMTLNFTGAAGGVTMSANYTATVDYTNASINFTNGGIWTQPPSSKNMSYTATNKLDSLSFTVPYTISANGSLILAGNSTVNRAFIKSNTLGTPRTITVPSTATVSITNTDFQDITMAGTFSTGATASSIGDALGNTFGWSSVQPDVSAAQTLVGTGTINWSTAANWTSRVPLPQDDVNLGSSSTATTLTADMPRMGRNIDASGYLQTLSFASTPNTLFGNVTLGGSNTLIGTQALSLAGRGAQTITSNGQAFPQGITIMSFGGTYTLQDTLTNTAGTAALLVSTGCTFALGGQTAFLTSLTLQATSTLTGNGSSIVSIPKASGTVINTNATAITTGFTGAVKFTGTVASTLTFSGGGRSWPTVIWASSASTGTLIVSGANTFSTLQVVPGAAKTVQFPASTTQTISTLLLSGGTNYLTVNSSTGGTPATLSVANAGFVGHNLSVKDITISGAGTPFYAAQSVNVSGNTGWTFGLPTGTPTSTLPSRGVGGWLLKRDINPANDNSPTWLEKAA